MLKVLREHVERDPDHDVTPSAVSLPRVPRWLPTASPGREEPLRARV